MNSETMNKTKLPKGMLFENHAKLGDKPNWKIVPANIEAYPSFAVFCDVCRLPWKNGKPTCNCED